MPQAAVGPVVAVGSVRSGGGPGVVPDRAVVELDVRAYDDTTRTHVPDAIERIASFPPTVNNEEPTRRVADAFAAYFGDDAHTVEPRTAGEDMSEIPRAFGAPSTYWAIGGTDPERYAEAMRNGTVSEDTSVNHSAGFAPFVQPTPDTKSPR